jgi:hypothetical protein
MPSISTKVYQHHPSYVILPRKIPLTEALNLAPTNITVLPTKKEGMIDQ